MLSSLFCPQTMGENAPSQLVLYHYSDLLKSKGIVLMTAEMDAKFIVRDYLKFQMPQACGR